MAREENMNNIIVRQANLNDADSIFNLWIKLAKDHMKKENNNLDIVDLKAENKYREILEHDSTCIIFVVENNKDVVGFAELYIKEPNLDFSFERYAYILHCYIDDEYRSTTAIFKLHEAVKQYLKNLNIKYLHADVYVTNTKFYKNICLLNFKPYRTRFIEKLDE